MLSPGPQPPTLAITLFGCSPCLWRPMAVEHRCPGAGEAQKIDRIMEKFAERYCEDNPGAFASADGPYLLSFALIMLNTDAHNPRAEKKLTCEDFVTMCQAQVGPPLLYARCSVGVASPCGAAAGPISASSLTSTGSACAFWKLLHKQNSASDEC